MLSKHKIIQTHPTAISRLNSRSIDSKGCRPNKRSGGTKWGTSNTRLYETSMDTATMDHFIQKSKVTPSPSPPHNTPTIELY